MSLDVEPVFERRLDDRRGRWASAVIGLVLVAVVGAGLLPTDQAPIVAPHPTPRPADRRPATPAAPVSTPREVADVAVEPPPAATVACLPRIGPLEPGWYSETVVGRGSDEGCENFLRFRLASRSWTSENGDDRAADIRLRRGTPGAVDGAFLRFGEATDVYSDPCGGTLVRPAIDRTADALAAAIASMRGVVVTDPTRVRLRWSTARYLVVSVPADIGCPPDETHLWVDDSGHVRTPAVPGATIRLWIFHPNGWSDFRRVVIEAETYPGTGPLVVREIEAIVASIDHGG